MLVKMKDFFANEQGQGMVEYGLMVGLIALVVILALSVLGTGMRDYYFNRISDTILNPRGN
ncbi:MAG: Flp family type IVb pilin [Eubacterium sp.]